MQKSRRNFVRRAIRAQLFDSLGNERALVGVIDCEVFFFDGPPFGIRRKVRRRTLVEADGKQAVFSCRIDRLKAEFFGKALIGQPRLLLFRAQHAHARFSLRPRVLQT